MTATIYMLVDIKSGSPFYIGSTSIELHKRERVHRSHSKTKKSPVYLYIRENKIEFNVEEIESGCFEKKEDRYRLEGYWSSQISAWGFRLYNKVYATGNGRRVFYEDYYSVIKLMAAGDSYKTIAKKLKIGEHSVWQTAMIIRCRLSVRKNKEVVNYFFQNGLID